MKKFVRAMACLLPLMMSACFHRTHQAQNPPTAPPIELPTQPVATPAPPPVQTTPPAETTPAPSTREPTAESKPPEESTKPPAHHKKRESKPPAPAQEAAAPEPSTPNSGVSAIGNLSAGDSTTSHQETENSINATERGLKSIHRNLSTQEQRTAAQITEFLKQARAALASGDVDGAHTLALKARVLLNELSH